MNELQGKQVDKIEITTDGKTVVATALKKRRLMFYNPLTSNFSDEVITSYDVVGTASAKCCPNDIFDFNIGAKLAMDRLYEGYDMTPRPKRKPYNGKIFIHQYPGTGLLNNCLYRVKDGIIQDCWYHKDAGGSYIFKDMTNDELCRTLQIELYGSDAPSAKVIAYFVNNDKT